MNIERYLKAFENTWADDTPAAKVRFVVLDTETTGLDPRRDRMITIGAVVVCGGEILLDDAFEVLLKIAYNNSSGLPDGRRHRGPSHRPRYRGA